MAHCPIDHTALQSPVSSVSAVSSRFDRHRTGPWFAQSPRSQQPAPPKKDDGEFPPFKSVLSLPRARTSLFSIDHTLRSVPAHPSMCPMMTVTEPQVLEELTPDPMALPSWWTCARPEWTAIALPLVVLVVAAICWFVIDGLTAKCWYAALYVALSMAMLVSVFFHFACSTQRLLEHARSGLTTVLVGDHDVAPERLVSDPRVRFLQVATLSTDKMEAITPPDPLDFVQAELDALPTGPEGYIIINTTGIILWANTALLEYFGYDADELVHENIRALMPKAYANQHDHFVRKHIETGQCRVLGRSREVPALDKSGMQSIVMLKVDDRIDPSDPNNRLFLGRMDFNMEVPLLQTVRRTLQAGTVHFEEALKVLEGIAPEAVVASNATGTILFANKAAHNLFQWREGELVGEKVNVLMAEPFASAHDGFLQAYQRRAFLAQHQGLSLPPSSMVGSGRDLMAMAKSGQRVRVFLMVTRMDRPSGRPQDCIFVAKMVHISSDPMPNPTCQEDACGMLMPPTASQDVASNSGSSGLERSGSICISVTDTMPQMPPVDRFVQRRCTVVCLALEGLGDITDTEVLQCDFNEVLGLVFALCSHHRGLPHWVVGSQLFAVFNVASLHNPCHRTSAAAFMLQLEQAYAITPLAQRCTLRVAAVSSDGFCGQWGTHHLLTGHPLDCATALLHAGHESRTENPVIDGVMYEELQYSYSCRQVNRVMLPNGTAGPGVVEVYELLSLHETTADQWMYEMPDTELPPSLWKQAWAHLPPDVETTALGPRFRACPTEACRLIECHLQDHTDDATAQWLLSLLTQQCRQPVPSTWVRQGGPLAYWLQFDSVPQVSNASQTCGTDSVASDVSLMALSTTLVTAIDVADC